jgi:AraC-like DNA-binding protein
LPLHDNFLTFDDTARSNIAVSFIRGTALLGFPELVAELGYHAEPLLLAAGIDAAAVGNPDAFISYRSGIDLLESASETTMSPDFGRRLATRQGIEILGPVGVAARTAPTVGAALAAIGQYLSVYSPAIMTTVESAPNPNQARFVFTIVLDRLPEHGQAVELTLGVTLRTFRLLIGRDYTPVTVHLPHSPIGDRREYTQYFGTRVRFDEPSAAFTIDRADLARPLPSDSEVHAIVQRYLRSVAPAHGDELCEPVRRMIRRMLPAGGPALEPIAAQFAMHPRTLQRRLTDEDATFAGLVDEVRREVVEHYLGTTQLPLSQLAAVAGYSEQSALTRSCQRWFGSSPSAYRRRERKPLSPRRSERERTRRY